MQVSTGPLWTKMSFLEVHILNETYHCGVWGYTADGDRGLGYIVSTPNIGFVWAWLSTTSLAIYICYPAQGSRANIAEYFTLGAEETELCTDSSFVGCV